jgi:hypothetical protein
VEGKVFVQLFFKSLSFLHLLIFVYNVWATSPFSPFGAEPIPPLVLQFCWRDNKKDTAFWVVLGAESYTEIF